MSQGRLIADRYELKGLLGKGGMGEVFLALDHRLQTPVALKRVPLALSLEPGIRDALVQEARIMARLSHSNIVRLFDLADSVDGMFIVLEFIPGPSFDKVLKLRPVLEIPEVQRMIDQVAQGLTLAHSLGIVHRDLKPSNLLLAFESTDQRHFERDGTHPQALLAANWKVTDFGLAKVVEQLKTENISGRVVGTPIYMAPEQFRGEVASSETDVYALALIAYQCLSGKLPTGGAEPAYFHIYVTPPPLAHINPTINAVLARALQKDRKQRYPSVAAFAQAFADAAVAKPQTPLPLPSPSPSKLKYLLPFALAGLFGGATYFFSP